MGLTNLIPLIFSEVQSKKNNSYDMSLRAQRSNLKSPKFLQVFTIVQIFLFFSGTLHAQDQPFNGAQGKFDPRLVLSELKYDTQEDLEESRRSLQNALAFDPGNPDYHFELSRVYGALYDDSVRGKLPGDPQLLNLSQNELEQVLMIRPEDIPAHYNLGVIYKRRKKMEHAREEFYRVLKLSDQSQSASPVAVSAWMQIGATYEDQGFFEDARDAYMKARELGGPRPEVQAAMEDLKSHQVEYGGNEKNRARNDSWTRQYVSGSEFTQFGSEAIKAKTQSAGVGALVPIVGQLLFQQFMSRRKAASAQDQNL